jgi:hypothetical protein
MLVHSLLIYIHHTFATVQGEEDPDIRLTLGKMEPLSKVFLARNQALAAEEGDFVGGGGAQRKSAQVRAKGKEEWNTCALYVFNSIVFVFFSPSHQQPVLPSDTEGSLWWHRNFAKGDDALFNAQWECIEYVPIGWFLVCLWEEILCIITYSSFLFATNEQGAHQGTGPGGGHGKPGQHE